MTKRKRPSGDPRRQSWDEITVLRTGPDFEHGRKLTQPMAKAFFGSGGTQHHYVYRTPQRAVSYIAFDNRLYDGAGLEFEDGSMHLSFKRKDRSAVHDWRHIQAIKNSVAGPEREAIEIYPAESNLVDAANEYHLWVLPEDMESPLGFRGSAAIGDPNDGMDHAAYRRGGPPGGRQRTWEDGIPTGANLYPGPGTERDTFEENSDDN